LQGLRQEVHAAVPAQHRSVGARALIHHEKWLNALSSKRQKLLKLEQEGAQARKLLW